jgi:5-dehydro-2-deoxygluconokinase
VEASGRRDFAFESPDWRERLDELDPAWAKALVRYNPEGDRRLNERQLRSLVHLSDHCRSTGRSLMLEVLVPPEPLQLARVADRRDRFDLEVRPELMVRAVREAHEAGVELDLWKIEGFDRADDYRAVADAARADGRDDVACVVLGRGADRGAVDRWLRAGAGVAGFVGFAIGRSIWWDALRSLFDGAGGENEAAARIATEYLRFVGVWDETSPRAGS